MKKALIALTILLGSSFGLSKEINLLSKTKIEYTVDVKVYLDESSGLRMKEVEDLVESYLKERADKLTLQSFLYMRGKILEELKLKIGQKLNLDVSGISMVKIVKNKDGQVIDIE